MQNNLVLKRLKFTLKLTLEQVLAVFLLAEVKIHKDEVRKFLLSEDVPEYIELSDERLEDFFKGLITWNRGIPLKEIVLNSY